MVCVNRLAVFRGSRPQPKGEITTMKKKFRCLLAALLAVSCLVAVLPVQAVASWRFTDVPYNIWYADAVDDLVSRGILKGKTSSRFDPNGTLTRGEFAAMLARSALTEDELRQYNYAGTFRDVPAWARPYVNWVYEAGVADGVGNGRFAPNQGITREQMAKMVVGFAQATGRQLDAEQAPVMFTDYHKISSYATASVVKCQRAGVINGFPDGSFRPRAVARRCDAAKLYSGFLEKSYYDGYEIVYKRPGGTAVSAVEIEPHALEAQVTMGNQRVRGGEHITSVINRTGAKIAVNGGFFDMGSYDPYGTIINDGKLVTVYNAFSPAKSSINMDSTGWFSVENFSTDVTVTVNKEDGSQLVAKKAGVNRFPDTPADATRVVFTEDWGGSLGFTPRFAAAVDAWGNVVDVGGKDMYIPEDGFVLAQRGPRQEDASFFQRIEVGDTIDVTHLYIQGDGSELNLDIVTSLAAGPKIVKDGQAYGNYSTYAAEGLGGIGVDSPARRVCIGIKYDGTVVILTTVASLPTLSNIMVSMGCEHAVNLDGGGSTNLYVNGKWLYGPQDRLLSNVLYFT